MTTIARVQNVKTTWALLLPSCPAPEDFQIGRWVSRFSDEELDYAIQRTAQKFRAVMPSDPQIVARYATGILNNERRHAAAAQQGSANPYERRTWQMN